MLVVGVRKELFEVVNFGSTPLGFLQNEVFQMEQVNSGLWRRRDRSRLVFNSGLVFVVSLGGQRQLGPNVFHLRKPRPSHGQVSKTQVFLLVGFGDKMSIKPVDFSKSLVVKSKGGVGRSLRLDEAMSGQDKLGV